MPQRFSDFMKANNDEPPLVLSIRFFSSFKLASLLSVLARFFGFALDIDGATADCSGIDEGNVDLKDGMLSDNSQKNIHFCFTNRLLGSTILKHIYIRFCNRIRP